MIIIKLQVNTSPNNSINKNITNIIQLEGTLKENTNLINPSIMIESDFQDIWNCNYMDIPSFGRKYFVTNIESIRTGILRISAHVDVLSTYKEGILANKAIIHRAENNAQYNLLINDGSLVSYQNPFVITKSFPNGFTGFKYILTCAG